MFGVRGRGAGAALAASLAFALTLTGTASAGPLSPTPVVDPAWPVDARGDGCAAPVWPEADASYDDSRVLVIGDSLIRDTRMQLEGALTEAGWIPTVRCWGAKGTDWGVTQVKRARQLTQLPDRVVVSLGTNDIWWLGIPMDVAVDQMMRALGPKREVYWVNLWFGDAGFANYDRLPRPTKANRILRAKAKQYPNLHIINFATAFRTAARAGKGVGWADGVHLNAAGYRLRTHLIVESLTPISEEPPPTEDGPGGASR